MCPPLVLAIPAIGSFLATAGTVAGVAGATATTAGTVLGMTTATAMSVLSIASAAAGLYGQKQTAKSQTQLIAQQADAEREEVLDIAEEELGTLVKDARKSRASARVAAAESGAAGASFAASMNQSISDQNEAAALASKRVAFKQRGVDDRQNTALAGVRSPSALTAGLTIAGAAARGHSQGQSMEDRLVG